MRPPFRTVWTRSGSALLEFPPVMSGNRIFQLADDATLGAIDKYTGQTLWSRRLGALSASTPAVSGNTVYATVLSRSPGSQAGRVVALNTLNGHFRWHARPAQPRGVLPPARQRQALLRLPERHGLRAQRTQRATSCGPTTPPAPSRPAQASPAECSISATTQASCKRWARSTAHLLVAQRLRRRPARQRHFLLHPSGHVRPGVPRQHRRTRICL